MYTDALVLLKRKLVKKSVAAAASLPSDLSVVSIDRAIALAALSTFVDRNLSSSTACSSALLFLSKSLSAGIDLPKIVDVNAW